MNQLGGWRGVMRAVVAAALLIGMLPGCKMSSNSGLKMDPFGSADGRRRKLMSREQLQNRLMSFADRYLARMAEATDRLAALCPRPGARALALTTRYYPSLAVVSIAADAQPEGAILDMVTVVTLERIVWGNGWAVEAFGDHAPILMEAQLAMEGDIWEILEDVLPEPDRKKLRSLLEKWVAENPKRRYVSNMRFDEFASERGPAGRAEFTIDFGPSMLLAPVDDTARAVTETRLLGERMTFLASRLPMLIGWQTEMLFCNILGTPELRSLVADSSRLSESAAQLSASVKNLPTDVARAHRAALTDFDSRAKNISELVGQIRGGLTDTQRVTESISQGMRDWKQAVDGTRDAATAIDGMLLAADKLSARWKSEPTSVLVAPQTEPREGTVDAATSRPFDASVASDAAPAHPSTAPSRPFDVLDYGRAATELADAARELNRLADNTDKVLASQALDTRLREIDTSTTEWIDHAFRRGVQLLLIAGATVLAIAFLLRLTRRRAD